MGTFTNGIKTVLLLGILTGLVLWVGSLWGASGLTTALIFVFLMNFGLYFFSDKMVLAMYGAKPVPKGNWLYNLVGEVAKKDGLPPPNVYIIPTNMCNAFATGRSPKHAAVACTEGILKILTRDELKGVLAHELSHVKNRDMLITTIAATLAGVIMYVARIAQWGMIFGGNNNNKDGGNTIETLMLIILTPIVATLIQLAISRSREYQADESGARLLKTGMPLANALQKLEGAAKTNPLKASPVANATSSLFIVNPFKAEGIVNLFMTHPSTSMRIQRLKAMKF